MPSEPGWIGVVVSLVAGFLLLAKGADWLVGGSSQVARRLGVSTMVIGLTIVAFGTSAPEIVVSVMAASTGKADISLGNVLGSNVANIGLVLGACAVVLPRVLESRLAARELLWLFLSLALLWYVSSDRAIERYEGLLLLGAFAIFNGHLWVTSHRDQAPPMQSMSESRHPWLGVVAGTLSISFGAKLVVDGASGGAILLDLPASVVALTVVAIGTSLPELAAGLGSAFKGEADISIGNVIGSNVFNLLAVVGIVALIQPLDPEHFGEENAASLDAAFAAALAEDFQVVLGFSLAAAILPWIGGSRGGRAKGMLLLVGYFVYSAWLYLSRG